jgi:catechol 2,3-dioxygenase
MSSAAEESSRSELHPEVRIGHVHLRVADLDRATSFYRDVLGFDVSVYGADYGLPGAAFLSAGGYHHHIGLNTWHSQRGTPPPEGHTGLHHFAILYPDRRELARAVERLLEEANELEAPSEPRESPQTVEEEPQRAEPNSATGGAQESARRPWWRRVLRG